MAGCQAAEGAHHPQTVLFVTHLARILHLRGDRDGFEESEVLFRRALAAHTEMSGLDAVASLLAANNLALLLLERRGGSGDDDDVARLEEAEALLQQAVEGCTRTLGPDHKDTLNVRGNLAMAKLQQLRPAGDSVAAVQAQAESEATVREVLRQLQAPPHSLPADASWVRKFSNALRSGDVASASS